MGLIEAWLNTAVREGFADGRPLADIAEETGLSESEVLRREEADPAVSRCPGEQQLRAALITAPAAQLT
jgi:hypothetical protein